MTSTHQTIRALAILAAVKRAHALPLAGGQLHLTTVITQACPEEDRMSAAYTEDPPTDTRDDGAPDMRILVTVIDHMAREIDVFYADRGIDAVRPCDPSGAPCWWANGY